MRIKKRVTLIAGGILLLLILLFGRDIVLMLSMRRDIGPAPSERALKVYDEISRLGKEDKLTLSAIKGYLNDEDWGVRMYAASALGRTGRTEETIPLLIKTLKDENKRVRQSSASALREIVWDLRAKDGDIHLLEPVIPLLIENLKDRFIKRCYPADALSEIGEVAVPELIDALEHKKVRVRRGAAYALGNIKDKRAVDPLIKLLRDRNKYVRRSAVSALGKIRDKKAIKPLKEIALKDRDKIVREYAVKALEKLGERNPIQR